MNEQQQQKKGSLNKKNVKRFCARGSSWGRMWEIFMLDWFLSLFVCVQLCARRMVSLFGCQQPGRRGLGFFFCANACMWDT